MRLERYFYSHVRGFMLNVRYVFHQKFRTSDMTCLCSVLKVNGLYLARLTWFCSSGGKGEPSPVFDCTELEDTYDLAVSKLEPYMTLSSELGLPPVHDLLKAVLEGCKANPEGVEFPDSHRFFDLELSHWYWKKSNWKYFYG